MTAAVETVATNQSTGSSVAVAAPSGATAGDLLIGASAHRFTSTHPTIDPSTGWTSLHSGGSAGVGAFGTWASEYSSGSSWTFASDDAQSVGAILRVTGHGGVVASDYTFGSGSTASAPSLLVPDDDHLLVTLFYALPAEGIGTPSGMDPLLDVTNDSGSGSSRVRLAAFSAMVNAGSSGARTAALGASTTWVGLSILIAPSVAGEHDADVEIEIQALIQPDLVTTPAIFVEALIEADIVVEAGPELHSGSGLPATLALTPGLGEGAPTIPGLGAGVGLALGTEPGAGIPAPAGSGTEVDLILTPGLGEGTSDGVELHSGSGLPVTLALQAGPSVGSPAIAGDGATVGLELLAGQGLGAVAVTADGQGVVLVLRPGVGMGSAGSYTYHSDRGLVPLPVTRTLIPLED